MGNFLTGMSLTNGITMTVAPPLAQKAIFGFGNSPSPVIGYVSTINLVSSTGVVATDTATSATGRSMLAAAGYGGDKAIFGYGQKFTPPSTTTFYSMTNLVSNTGTLGSDVTGVGTGRLGLAAATYGTDKAIFGYGAAPTAGVALSMTNLVSNTGVVATDTPGVGTARIYLGAAGYGGDKAIFGFGTNYSITNLVSNTGVVATDTPGVGTARGYIAGTGYGGDKAIFGFGESPLGPAYNTSITNLVSNTGVVATDTPGVGTTRLGAAGAGYGTTGQAIFGFGAIGPAPYVTGVTNLVSSAGVVATDTTAVGTARQTLAAASFSYT